LWRPIFIIIQFVIVLWRELNCVKIPQCEANKSANRWGNLRAKGGVVPPSVYIYLSLLVCGSNIFLLHDFAAYFYLQQYLHLVFIYVLTKKTTFKHILTTPVFLRILGKYMIDDGTRYIMNSEHPYLFLPSGLYCILNSKRQKQSRNIKLYKLVCRMSFTMNFVRFCPIFHTILCFLSREAKIGDLFTKLYFQCRQIRSGFSEYYTYVFFRIS
jgi:hypothetical protein